MMSEKNDCRDLFYPQRTQASPKLILFYFMIVSLLSPIQTLATPEHIFMDGYFTDWEGITPLYSDAIGDQKSGTVDFGTLWLTHDDRFLFIRIEVGAEINLQNDNSIALFLDCDNNPATGRKISGIGAELEWNFGEKTGFFISGSTANPIQHSAIDLVTLPTITSTEFEIAIARDARPANNQFLFTRDTIRVLLADKSGGDLLPDSGKEVSFIFANQPQPPIPRLSMDKFSPDHLRILTYNVLRDNLFNSPRPHFERILKAIQPDIIGFEEIYEHSADQTAAVIESVLPSTWYRAKVATDIIVISRYRIKNSYDIGGNGGFLIDLRSKYDSDLLLIVAHPPSGSRNFERQYEIDQMMAFVRDAKTPGGELDLLPNTPIIIMGDMNLVGYSAQLQTFLKGDIVNQAQFGPSFKPDWDETDFTALVPRQTDLLMAYTWYDENNAFSPGRLDYIIFSDSVIEPANHFILFTPEMSPDSLAKYGLHSDDAIRASDHLPIVADFILPIASEIKSSEQSNLPERFSLAQNFPNPFNPMTRISYWLPDRAVVVLKIFNLLGEEITTLVDTMQTRGYQTAGWDGTDGANHAVESGIYLFKLQVNEESQTRKMLLLR